MFLGRFFDWPDIFLIVRARTNRNMSGKLGMKLAIPVSYCGGIKGVIKQVGVGVNCADIVGISESVGISLLNKWSHKILQVRRS